MKRRKRLGDQAKTRGRRDEREKIGRESEEDMTRERVERDRKKKRGK